MRLSHWRASAPSKDAAGPKVVAVVDPLLAALGAEQDPHSWVVWGEEPGIKHTILVPTDAGLVSCYVRVNVSGEGPRASAKLVRWNRVQIGELAMETSGSHRLLSCQIEGHVIQAADEAADRVAAFALEIFAAMDGRPRPEPPPAAPRRRSAGSRPAATGKAATLSAGTAAGRRTPGSGR